MVYKIDHVAIIVSDVDEALKTYSEMFGFEVVEEMGGSDGEFKAVLVRAGDITLEFIQPLTDQGSLAKFLRERGGGLHHVSFATRNIKQDLKKLKEQGRKLINEEPMSVPSGEAAFVHPGAAENVLVELVQRPQNLQEMTSIKIV
jgi:methylmalonyl-CoA epimerase